MNSFHSLIWREGSLFVAHCLEVNIASQGETEQGAEAALREALGLHFMQPVATVFPKIATVEIRL
jgi:predicted RNase H-like HicB family nuclease